jgi:hypothetical protein
MDGEGNLSVETIKKEEGTNDVYDGFEHDNVSRSSKQSEYSSPANRND